VCARESVFVCIYIYMYMHNQFKYTMFAYTYTYIYIYKYVPCIPWIGWPKKRSSCVPVITGSTSLDMQVIEQVATTSSSWTRQVEGFKGYLLLRWRACEDASGLAYEEWDPTENVYYLQMPVASPKQGERQHVIKLSHEKPHHCTRTPHPQISIRSGACSPWTCTEL